MLFSFACGVIFTLLIIKAYSLNKPHLELFNDISGEDWLIHLPSNFKGRIYEGYNEPLLVNKSSAELTRRS